MAALEFQTSLQRVLMAVGNLLGAVENLTRVVVVGVDLEIIASRAIFVAVGVL